MKVYMNKRTGEIAENLREMFKIIWLDAIHYHMASLWWEKVEL